MRDKGIPFTAKDVTATDAAMDELLALTDGVRGTPVIRVGDTVIRGFDRGRLQRLLGIS